MDFYNNLFGYLSLGFQKKELLLQQTKTSNNKKEVKSIIRESHGN